jgi:hypothetical protein
MRRLVDASHPDDFARAPCRALPTRDDAPLALTLLRLLTHGQPTVAALAQAAARTHAVVVERVACWPNIERDHDAACREPLTAPPRGSGA